MHGPSVRENGGITQQKTSNQFRKMLGAHRRRRQVPQQILQTRRLAVIARMKGLVFVTRRPEHQKTRPVFRVKAMCQFAETIDRP